MEGVGGFRVQGSGFRVQGLKGFINFPAMQMDPNRLLVLGTTVVN